MLGHNMFTYCNNNPVNMSDPDGKYPIPDCIKTDMQNWNFVAGIKEWADSTFGAECSTVITTKKAEVNYLPDPLPITAKSGAKTTKNISKLGNCSKPISVYAIGDSEHPIISSVAGIKFTNVLNCSLNICLGLDNIGIYGSYKSNNTTNSLGIKANLSELKGGIEGSSAIKWDTTTETSYTNVSGSLSALVWLYIFITTSEPMPSRLPEN